MHGTGRLPPASRRTDAAATEPSAQRAEQQALATFASAAGLCLVSPDALTIARRRCGRGFTYVDEKGRRVADAAMLRRIRSLAIPPAYRDVRIARQANAHLQAVGRDDAGRVQYRYHPGWEDIREGRKIERLAALCRALPRIRRRIARDLRRGGTGRRRAMAAIVTLIDRTHIRIGCEDYVHSGRARGATTLLKQNVRCDGDGLQLTFRGKGGHPVRCGVACAPLAAAVGDLARLRGRRIFQYVDESGAIRRASASEANRYLQEIAGIAVTAKDFRTLAATATAAELLRRIEPDPSRAGRRRQIAAVMKEIAGLLANTPAVARKSYVHRELLAAFRAGRLHELFEKARASPLMSRGEAAIAALFAAESG